MLGYRQSTENSSVQGDQRTFLAENGAKCGFKALE
jgi:hypothetical protein